MYPVTKQYKDVMRAPIREAQAHATVYFGMFDQAAAGDATLGWTDSTEYAHPSNINSRENIHVSYATFEPNQLRLDGAQALLPSNSALWLAQGFVSSVAAGENGVFSIAPYIDVQFSEQHSMVGLTLNFDAAYDLPAQLTVLSYRDGVLLDEQTVTEIDAAVWMHEFLLEDVDRLVIRFDKAKKAGSRARLNNVKFGIGYTYADQDLQTLTEKHLGSPLSMTLPTSSLTFTLFNEEGRFDVDSDTALQRFLAGGQRGIVDYGIDTEDGIEVIPGGKWWLASWNVSGISAEFTMEDALARLNRTTFDRFVYNGIPKSLYALAQIVFNDAGLLASEYYIDPVLNNVLTSAPLPIGTHATALQLIANAGKCMLYVNRSGVVTLERLVPDVAPAASSTTQQTAYSAAATATGDDNVIYATLEPSFMRLDGAQLLVPSGGGYENAGWTASAVSDSAGVFASNELLLTYAEPTNVFNVEVDWGAYPPPKKARLSCRVDGVWKSITLILPTKTVESYAVSFRHCDAVKLEVLESSVAGQRARVRRIAASMLSDFVLGKNQIYGNTNGKIDVKLRNVIVQGARHLEAQETSEIATVEIMTNSGWARIPHDLYADMSYTVSESGMSTEITHYAYVSYARITSIIDQPVKLTLTGKQVVAMPFSVEVIADTTGEDLPLKNPLITADAHARSVAEWVRDYYVGRVTYESDMRGFPELDNFDTVYMWDGGSAVVNSIELTYNGAFNQKLKLRRR